MRIEPAPRVSDASVVLRPIERGDVDAWYAYIADPVVIEHTSWDVADPSDLSTIVDACNDAHARTTARYAIVDERTGALAGTIGLVDIVWRFRAAELVYDLAPSHAGRGIASACARIVADWLLGAHDFIRVEATTLDTNHASQRVLDKAGFVHEGTMRHKKLVRGVPRDFHLFAKTRAAAQAGAR